MNKLSGVTAYQLSIHLVFVTKYRRKVINAAILKRLSEIFIITCEKWECEVKQFNGEAEHVQMLIDINPSAQIRALANNLKTVSSRLIRKEFPKHCAKYFYKPVFCQIGYCVISTGGASMRNNWKLHPHRAESVSHLSPIRPNAKRVMVAVLRCFPIGRIVDTETATNLVLHI